MLSAANMHFFRDIRARFVYTNSINLQKGLEAETLVREATVVRINGKLMACAQRSEACAQCRACAHGQTEQVLLPLPEDAAVREGDQVQISLPDGSVGRASLLCYGIPLVMLLAGLGAGAGLSTYLGLAQDLYCAAGGLLLTLCGFLIVRLIDRHLQKKGCMQPAVLLTEHSVSDSAPRR